MVKAILIKPLDGHAAGTEREFSQVDFDHLKRLGAVKAAAPVANKAEPPVLNKVAGRTAKAG